MNISKLRNIPKSYIIIFLVVIMLGTFSFVIPSFANYKNRNALDDLLIWDGTIASSYAGGNGTENDPYLISSGSELAYFSSMLKENTYENTYFKITKDILLNEGFFQKKDNEITYLLNDTNYYLQNEEVYIDSEYQNKLTDLNVLSPINGFSGFLDGNNHTIYGYYGSSFMDDINSAQISNLFFSNFLIEDSNASLIGSINDSSLDNLIISSGFIKGTLISSLINSASNVTINKVVIDALQSANNVSGFIHNANGSIDINSSYIKGTISSTLSSPFFGSINNSTITLDKVYNSSTILGESYDLALEITNSFFTARGFNTQNLNGIIKTSIESEIDLDNYYSASSNVSVMGEKKAKIINESPKEGEKISNEENVTDAPINEEDNATLIASANAQDVFNSSFFESLGFNKFISNDDLKSNPESIWLYEDNDMPTLYTEYLNNSSAIIRIKDLSWQYLNFNPEKVYFNSPIAFSIENENNVKPLKEIYYYLSSEILSKDDIKNITSWETYTNFINLEEDGKYIIYVKTVDINDEESYLNSDIIIKDETTPTINIKGNEVWDSLKNENLKYSYLTKAQSFTINASDDTSEIKNIEYAILNSINMDLESITWEKYTNKIDIQDYGLYIIYAKVTDNADNIAYINTDYIVYNGYTLSAKNNLVNNLSKISYNFTFKDNYNGAYKGTRVLNFSENLPVGTMITLIDNNSKKAYYYDVLNSTMQIYLTDFKKLGSLKDVYLNEDSINSYLNEDLKIIIDFSKAQMESDILNLKVELNLYDLKGNLILGTDSGASSSIYLNKEATYNLVIDNNADINYQSDFSITKKLQLKLLFQDNIIDTSLNNQKLGLEIKLLDENNRIVPKEKLKNWLFKLNNQIYTPDSNGIIRLKWQDKVLDATSTLEISALSDVYLPNGNYKLAIKAITSYDGIYSPLKETEETIININKNDIIKDAKVIITPNEDYQILYQTKEVKTLDFLTNFGNLGYQKIEVSLLKKEKLTAYNQNYILYDDQSALSYSQNNYGLRLNLDLSKLAPGGYKFVFKVYDKNNNIIEIINKLFIVR